MVFTPKLIPPAPRPVSAAPCFPVQSGALAKGERRPDWSWGLLLRLTPGRLQAGDGVTGASCSSVTCGPSPTPPLPSPRPRTPMSSSDQAGQYPALAWLGPRAVLKERPEVGGAGPPGPPGQPPADSFVCDTSLPETPADGGWGERGAGMKGVGWGPAWHSCSEGTAPSQLLHPPLRSRGQGSRCLAREAPHPEPPFSLGPSGAGARLRDGLPAVGSLGRWPGRALCVPGGRCHAEGGGWSVQGALRSGWGVGDLGLLKGQQVVEMKGQLALQDSSPPPASAPKWTQCQVDEGIKSWPQPKRPRLSLFT